MYNFESMCRTCSCTGDLQSLFEDKQMIVADMLTEIVDIKVMKGDNYPQNICIYCLERLTDAYYFKKQCHEMRTKFEEYLLINNKQTITVKSEFPNNLDMNEPEILLKESGEFLLHIENDDPDQVEDISVEQELLENNEQKTIKPKQIKSNNHIQLKSECPICSKKVTYLNKHLKLHKMKQKCSAEGQEKQNAMGNEENQSEKITKRKYPKPQCPICMKRVKCVKEHLRSHTKEKPFECEICGSKFSLRRNCLRHMKLHSGNKSHACDTCDQRFYEKYELVAHQSSHSTEKPVKCDHCIKTFKRKSQLRKHIAYIHEKSKKYSSRDTDKKSYLCNHCGKTFSAKPQLDKHELIHKGVKPYKCTQCTLSFRQSSHLKTHFLTHTGEKRYQCTVCEKKFAANGNLTIHMRIHTGETPHVCSICNKGFYDSSSLKKHIQNH